MNEQLGPSEDQGMTKEQLSGIYSEQLNLLFSSDQESGQEPILDEEAKEKGVLPLNLMTNRRAAPLLREEVENLDVFEQAYLVLAFDEINYHLGSLRLQRHRVPGEVPADQQEIESSSLRTMDAMMERFDEAPEDFDKDAFERSMRELYEEQRPYWERLGAGQEFSRINKGFRSVAHHRQRLANFVSESRAETLNLTARKIFYKYDPRGLKIIDEESERDD